jgi:hypothetical protein
MKTKAMANVCGVAWRMDSHKLRFGKVGCQPNAKSKNLWGGFSGITEW